MCVCGGVCVFCFVCFFISRGLGGVLGVKHQQR